MVKHADNVEGLLKISKQSVASPTVTARLECENFLKKHLAKYLASKPTKKKLSQDGALEELKKKNEILFPAANRIAKVMLLMETAKKNEIPDTSLDAEDIFSYQEKLMAKLKQDAQRMLRTLNTAEHLPLSIIAIIGESTNWVRYPREGGAVGVRRFKKEALSETLHKLIDALNKHPQSKILSIKNKVRKKSPLKREAAEALAQAWEEITGKTKEKLKRNRETGICSGEFWDFMDIGLQLFPIHINTEEAIIRLFE